MSRAINLTRAAIGVIGDTSGNIGIGTSTPAYKLDVNSTAAAPIRIARNGGTDANTGIQFNLAAVYWGAGVGSDDSFAITRNTLAFNSATTFKLNSSGNLGLGVTPSAWRSGDVAIDVGAASSLVSAQSANTRLYNNTYVASGGTNTYKTTAAASYYDQGSGVHRWFNAVSGTAGTAIASFTQAMTLDASGRLGLGVTSPTLSFEVGINAAKGYMHSGIGVFSVGTSTNHPYGFDINGTEQMRLTSTGLGIGTSSPSYKVEASNAGTVYVAATNSTAGFTSALGATSLGALWSNSSTTLPTLFYLNGTERMQLTQGGNLGLGVTPSAWDTSGSTKAIQVSTITSLAETYGRSVLSQNFYNAAAGDKYVGNGYASRYMQYQGSHSWYTAGNNVSGAGATLTFTQAMTLDASGNLGVGTTSPAVPLHVVGNARITGDIQSSGNPILYSYNGASAGTVNAGIQLVGSDPSIRFSISNAEKARIDSSGNLLVGTTQAISGSKVSVENAGFSAGSSSNSTQTNLLLSGYGYRSGATTYGNVSIRSSYSNVNNAASLEFYTDSNGGNTREVARIDSSGNLMVGTTSAYGRLKLKQGSSSDGLAIAAGSNESILLCYHTGSVATIDATYLSSGAYAPIAFNTSAAERMRIDTSGNLLVNMTAAVDVGRLQLGGTSSTMRFLPGVDNTGYIGQSTYRWAAIYAANGTIQTSDGREKNTIENSVLGLGFVNALRPVSYKWNVGENVVTYDDEGNQVVTPRAGTRTHFGFIAQEVKEVLGEQDFGGYVEEPNGRLGLRYDQFIAPLVKAIQEQQAIIEQLTARLDAANI